MGNVVFGWPNRVADATYSAPGGAWTAGSPISYLATRKLAQVARAGTKDQRSAHFYITTASAVACGIAALVGHNMSTTGAWRLRGWANDPRPAIDFSGCGENLPSWMTCTRSSVGTYTGSDGLLKTAATNTARWEYGSSGRLLGLLVEKSATNTLLYCRDGTNGVWTKASMTTALTATGIDGAVSSATRLTASAGNATIKQNGGGANGAFSVFLRRVTGSGTVELTINNFTNVTAVVLTTSWQRFTLTGVQSTVGVRIVTSGDAIEMDYAQSEGGFATSPILTTGSSSTRQQDDIQISNAGAYGASFTVGSMHVRAKLIGMSNDGDVVTLEESSTEKVSVWLTSAGVVSGRVMAGGSQVANVTGPTKAAGNFINAAISWQLNDTRASFDNVLGTQDTSCAMPTPSGTIQLKLGGVNACYHIETVRLWSTALTNAQLQALSIDSDDCETTADYDSGWVDAWPTAWVSGTTAEERAGVVGCSVLVPGSPQTYRYWRVDMDDESNTALLQLGRVFMGSRWQPTTNMEYGAALGYEQRSIIVENDSGAEDFVARSAPRIASISLPALSDVEGLGTMLEMIRRLGNTGEVLWQWDPDDTRYLPMRTFLARIRNASPLSNVFIERNQEALELREIL